MDVTEAHDRLADLLSEVGRQAGWATAGPYAARYVLPHALTAAELSVRTIDFAGRVDRCLALVEDSAVFAARRVHGRAVEWLDDLRRLAHLCPAGTRVGGPVPLLGLDARLYQHLELAVGFELAEQMSELQLSEFEDLTDRGDEAGALEWLKANRPDYRQVVADTMQRAWDRVLGGWDPPDDTPGDSAGSLARSLYQRWQRDPLGHHGDLDEAAEAAERAVRLTGPDHRSRTGRMIQLAQVLGDRIARGTGRPGDLDRLVEVRAELVARPDLEVPGVTHNLYGDCLLERWRRDPDNRAADLDVAAAAYERAVELLQRCRPGCRHRGIRPCGRAVAGRRRRPDRAHGPARQRVP